MKQQTLRKIKKGEEASFCVLNYNSILVIGFLTKQIKAGLLLVSPLWITSLSLSVATMKDQSLKHQRIKSPFQHKGVALIKFEKLRNKAILHVPLKLGQYDEEVEFFFFFF